MPTNFIGNKKKSDDEIKELKLKEMKCGALLVLGLFILAPRIREKLCEHCVEERHSRYCQLLIL